MDLKCILAFVLSLIAVNSSSCSRNIFYFSSSIPQHTTRYWIGPEYWTNRLQDWHITDGRIECIGAEMPLRTIHLLTRSLGPNTGDLKMLIRTGLIDPGIQASRSAWCGFLVGAGSPELDYKARAIIHHGSGKNGGLIAGIDTTGQIVFYDNENDLQSIEMTSHHGQMIHRTADEDLELRLFMWPQRSRYSLTLSVFNWKNGELLQEGTIGDIDPARLTGNIAIVSNGGANERGHSFWFRDLKVSGSKIEVHENRLFGPILCALYTLSDGVLKMTAQLPPIGDVDEQRVRLEISEAGSSSWQTIAEEKLVIPGWTATFRVPNWKSEKDFRYRLAYPLVDGEGSRRDFFYEGAISHDPVEKGEMVVAAFTGNSNTFGSFATQYDFTESRLWFPHREITDHVEALQPDLLVYTGDQVYEARPTEPDRSGSFGSYLDYLYKWYLWCWAHGELARNRPAICMPDDHDVYHGNIWGDGGRKARENPADGNYPDHYKGFEDNWRQDGGGYLMPAEFVNMVQRTQTGHLPDPYDPTPVEQGITVYYCSLTYGGISFAVLEDRKFKSSPSVMVPAGKVINGFPQVPGFDARSADIPGARLLGERQLQFLREWAADWTGAWAKVAVSQTIFADVSTYPETFQTDEGTPELEALPPGVVPPGYRLAQDMDSNGWPQTGRNKALHELRRGFAFMIGGDQHLGSIVHHGIDAWNDAGFSLCVPSIANLWPRRWYPPRPGIDHQPGMPPYTGKYLDGFGNHITVWAVSNPVISNHEPAELHDRAPGYGIARFEKKSGSITMECWPRYADPTAPDAKQYPGWPLTISVEDNYGRQAVAYLPTLQFVGLEDPVVQVIDENNGGIVYTIRARGNSHRCKVFRTGSYTLRIGEPAAEMWKVLSNVHTLENNLEETVTVEF